MKNEPKRTQPTTKVEAELPLKDLDQVAGGDIRPREGRATELELFNNQVIVSSSPGTITAASQLFNAVEPHPENGTEE